MPKATPSKGYHEKYGLWWEPLVSPVEIEREMIRRGGEFKKRDGTIVGNGLFFHFKAFQTLLWPEEDWHRWRELTLKSFLENQFIGILGPASSAKTHDAALFGLSMYYVFPDCCSVLCCSTEREMLEKRIWGEVKMHHKSAKQRHPWLPGQLTESRQIIMTDVRFAHEDGRDVRNAVCGIPAKKGGNFVGLGSMIGIKNKIVILIADEAQFLPRAFVDAGANLNKNQDSRGIPKAIAGLKLIALGNPKDTTDSLGIVCEPSPDLGGWDGGIDQTGGTKTWRTRFYNGICVQLVGSDSPNMDAPEDVDPPFPYLITRKAIQQDIQFYGAESLQFTMMDEGRMPKGLGTRRVVTRQMCLKGNAMEPPIWKDSNRTSIGFADLAYGGTGGDRAIFGELQFGKDLSDKHIIALIDTMLIPVSVESPDLPEYQLAEFCKAQCELRGIPPENFGFDSTGRSSFSLAIAKVWSPNVIGIEFGGLATDRPVSAQIKTPAKHYYKDRVSELWFNFRWIVMASQFRGLTDEVMTEFAYREWKLVGGNKTEVESKQEMKLKAARSPDLADGVSVGIEVARQRGFTIVNISNKTPASNQKWKEDLFKRTSRIHQSHTLTYR